MKHLPNLLTIARIVLTPVFLVLLLGGTFWGQFAAALIFIFAAISDWADGYIARKYGVSSRLGQFLDPLADKVLVLGAFFAFLFLPPDPQGRELAALWWWIPVLLIAARDLAVTLLRSWAERNGRSIATKGAAKAKTAVQLTFLITVLVFLVGARLDRFGGLGEPVAAVVGAILYSPAIDVALVATAALTVWTGALYFQGIEE